MGAAETFEIALKSNVAATAAKDAAALDKLVEAGKKVNDSVLSGNLDKAAELATIKAVTSELKTQGALAAKLAGFDADRAKEIANQRAALKKMTDDATGKTAENAAKAAAAEQRAADKAHAAAEKESLKNAKEIAKAHEKATKSRLDAAQKEQGYIRQGAGVGKFASAVMQVEKILGPKAAEGFTKAGVFLADAGPGLAMAGTAVAAGGTVVLAAAAALAAGAAKLISAAVQYGVEQTAAADKQKRILDKMTGGRGALTFDLALSLAGETGTDPNTAIERVKGLLQAKFSESEIPLIFKAAADLGEVKGTEKGKVFLEQLQKTAAKGKANEESLNALAEAGVRAESVLEKLRKKGESLDAVRARLKSGTIAAKEFTKAAAEAVEQDLGGIAGKGLDASFNRAKIGWSKVFTGLNLSPLQGALDNAAKVLDGPTGQALKRAFGKLGDSALKALFGPFQGAEGEKRLEKVGHALIVIVERTAQILDKAAPLIEKALDLIFDSGSGGKASGLTSAIQLLGGLHDVFVAFATLDMSGFVAAMDAITAAIGGLLGIDVSPAAGIGTSIVEGMTGGILSGASSVVASVKSVATDAINAAKAALGIASPSKVFADIGSNTALGFAKGANDNAGAAADAGAAMAGGATGAASGAAGGGAAGGGGAAPIINIYMTAAGPGADAQQAARAQAEALEPMIEASLRRIQRRLGEGGGSLATRSA